MKTITKNQRCYAMSAENQPSLRVASGETFRVETEDCYSGRLQTTNDIFTKDMWHTVNPATGPVYIENAAPGDVLKIELLEIRIRDYAVMCLERQSGPLGHLIQGVETSILPIENGRIRVNDGLSLPLRPMIGVIGTAPAAGTIPNGTPGEHGGNMDCKEITAGATVYLPVNVPGALLSLGDIHAIMGDGEVCICGAEVSGEITLRTSPTRTALPTPCVETPDALMFIAAGRTLDECEPLALDKTHRFLTQVLKINPNEAARLMSLAGDLRVNEIVNPLKTMRFVLPRKVLEPLGWTCAS